MLLSVDWDYYSGTVEHTFDAPIWGSRDREEDRVEAWRARARKRGGADWEVLAEDFPLHGDPTGLSRYMGRPTFVAWSHASAWAWLERFPRREVVNFDSHHDLYSSSGDPERVRPGNWAGLALKRQLVTRYTCVYPAWHENVRVAEGFDLGRTRGEIEQARPDVAPFVALSRGDALPPAESVEAVLLVQSPSWTNPAHDDVFLDLASRLDAEELTAPYRRSFNERF
ncbi:arginase [Deinococcus yavapaiensis]|uniref:Arginase family protein n=1 Tax=Deinococcus yavapaiensis KR-236 TaxID=694435 RepID=A0A318S9X4_9DEIO|nr:arginase [Deinococcus yavapaiensis]PYE55178.1 hypothetical protein DES52_1037 [Deinococcus yavapaiensis KR-236]